MVKTEVASAVVIKTGVCKHADLDDNHKRPHRIKDQMRVQTIKCNWKRENHSINHF